MASFSRPPAARSCSRSTWPPQGPPLLRMRAPISQKSSRPLHAKRATLPRPAWSGARRACERPLLCLAGAAEPAARLRPHDPPQAVWPKRRATVAPCTARRRAARLVGGQHERVAGGALAREPQQLQHGDAALQAAHARLERRVAQSDAPELVLARVLRASARRFGARRSASARRAPAASHGRLVPMWRVANTRRHKVRQEPSRWDGGAGGLVLERAWGARLCDVADVLQQRRPAGAHALLLCRVALLHAHLRVNTHDSKTPQTTL